MCIFVKKRKASPTSPCNPSSLPAASYACTVQTAPRDFTVRAYCVFLFYLRLSTSPSSCLTGCLRTDLPTYVCTYVTTYLSIHPFIHPLNHPHA